MSQRQCLPVNDNADASPESEQEFELLNMSAVNYLKQVRFERRKIPQIVTVHPLVTSTEPQVPVEPEVKFSKDFLDIPL